MSKISNTLMLLKVLETGRIYKISELSNILECSPRTIRTYKDDLEKAGILIESVLGRYGGYYYPNHSSKNYISFNKLDLNNLENLYLNLKNKTNENLDALLNVIEKLRYELVLTTKVFNNINKHDDEYKYISKAIHNNEKIIFYHKNKQISFIPHSIYIYSNNYFVTGINENIKQIRTYNFNDIKIKK